jgi:two-component system, OmpR family, response regulator QseB
MRVLLVEDQRSMRGSIVDHLKERGFAVAAVNQGREVSNAVATVRLDAVILDLSLPDSDGMEVLARLRAALRRPRSRRGTTYSLGGIVFDTATRQALARGRRMDLTRREAALLEEFLRVPGQVITKALLEDRLYALEDSGSINALEAAISRLRRKLAAVEAALRIETKWGIGYRLVEAAPDEGYP